MTSYLDAVKQRVRIARALVIRDMMMRFGRGNIGFAWVVLEPMILAGGVMVIWSLTMGGGKTGFGVTALVLTGYLPLTLWRNLTNGMIGIFRRTAPLLYHRVISLFDILLARQLLDTAGATLALLVLYFVLAAGGWISEVARLDLMIVGWLLMAWLACATGGIIAVATELWESADKIVQPFQYLMIPISGAFFMVEWLPPDFQRLVLINPTVHCYELFRAGFFGDQITAYYSISYVCEIAFVLTFLSVLCVEKVRPHVRLS